MPEEGAYEIMPYKEIVALKKEIEALKKQKGITSEDLLNSMNSLTKSMDGMLQLFKSAADEMKLEEKEKADFTRQIGPMLGRLNRLDEQNRTIAEGMVAIADMVKEIKGEKPELFKPKFKPKQEKPREPILPEYHPPRPTMPPPAPEPFGPMPPPAPPPELPPLEEGPMPPSGLSPWEAEMPPPGPMPPGPIGLPPMPEEPPLFEEKPKRGLFGRFRKK